MPLNPYQQAVSDLAHRLGLRGGAEQQVFQRPEFANLVNQFFGAIPLPAGIEESMVTSRTPSLLEFRDPQGYITRLERNLSGISPDLGKVKQTSTNRPAVLPSSGAGEIQALQGLLPQLTNLFSNPVALSQIDPATLQLLSQIADAENQALDEQFRKVQGTTVAQLVGQGIGSSSIAGSIMDQLLQGQGLVKNQAQGQQAQRQLGVQQFLTQGQQQRDQSLQQFITELLNQSLGRDVSGAQVGVQKEQIGEQAREFDAQFQQHILEYQEQLRQQEREAMWNKIFKGISMVVPFINPVAGLFGGGGGFGVPAPTAPASFPSSTVFGNFPSNPRIPSLGF